VAVKSGPPISRRELGGEILRSVSRSFYLSMRILPKPLREPVSLAYLLARATDTIADTNDIKVVVRQDSLRRLAATIQGNSGTSDAENLSSSFAPLQTSSSERKLIESLPSCVEWLEHIDHADRAEIRDVLAKINRGQSLDVARFAAAGEVRALSTAAELDEYTYLVAGCVGEFWTRLGFRHVAHFAERAPDEMLALGIRYGKALQLINILRDVGDDLRSGRCYFPQDELAAAGTRPADLLHNTARAEAIFQKWRTIASDGIAAGLEYASAIRNRRVRMATALPALIGARTIEMLQRAGPDIVRERIKIPRAEVRRAMLTALVSRRFAIRENNSAASA
jgi:farnesyl-diphosphate farnesyltransferase